MSIGSDKTEPATPKRRAEAAKRGDRLRSRDLSAAMLAVILPLWLTIEGPNMIAGLMAIMRGTFDFGAPEAAAITIAFPQADGAILAPLCALAFMLVVGLIVPPLLIDRGFNPETIAPRWSRLNPVAGLKRIWGKDAFVNLGTSLIKVCGGIVLALVLGATRIDKLVDLSAGDIHGIRPPGSDIIFDVLTGMAALSAVAGLIDLWIQWRRRETRLMMTKQEIREETRSNEGGPERKRAQRERQYMIAARSARTAMIEATVLLTNPSHFSIALRYRAGTDAVPIIVARGVDAAAEAIRDLAEEHKIPRVESPVLARALYFTGRVGQPVTSALYLAVATVLASLFELDAKILRERRGADISVPAALRFGPDGKLCT